MSRVVVVTGANQGLGLALVRGMCVALGNEAHVYLGARDPGRGQAAVLALGAEGHRAALLDLDVTDDASVAAAARTIARRHGGVDVVISNAAARLVKDVPAAVQVRRFIDTNNHGEHRMIRAFGPLLRDGGRFLVVASAFGSLSRLDPRLHGCFETGHLSLDDIAITMNAYAIAVIAGRDREEGWPDWMNIPSKVAQVAAMRIFARDYANEARSRDVLINAVCPGLVDTAASSPWFADMSLAQSPDVAARDVVWLATLPRGTAAPAGELVQHRKIIPWR